MRNAQKILLIIIYALFYTAYMSFFPFQAMYLLSLGYDKTAIAAVTTCTALGNFLIQYTVGSYADRMQSAGKLLKILLPASVFVTGFLYFIHGNLFRVILAVLPVTLFDFSAMGQLDAYTLAASNINSSVHYSTMRAVGGLTGAGASALFGILYAKVGLGYMFFFHGGIMFLSAFSLWFLPEIKKQTPAGSYQKKEKPGTAESSMHLLLWLPILFSGCLIFLGWRANIIYLPVLLKEAGGTSAHQGAAMAIMNISSFPVLLTFPQLTKHYSLSKLMAIGGTFMALRILFVPFLKSAQLLTMVQVLEGVSYGLLQPAIMELFARHAADHVRGRIVALWTGIQMALSTIITNLIVSGFSLFLELRAIFAIFAVITIIGMILLLESYGKITKSWRKNSEV